MRGCTQVMTPSSLQTPSHFCKVQQKACAGLEIADSTVSCRLGSHETHWEHQVLAQCLSVPKPGYKDLSHDSLRVGGVHKHCKHGPQRKSHAAV